MFSIIELDFSFSVFVYLNNCRFYGPKLKAQPENGFRSEKSITTVLAAELFLTGSGTATDTDGTNLQLLLRVKEMKMQNPTLPSGSI
ncbi:unnamed protein product [Brassica rapa subsp. trilocularis]